MGAGDRAGLPIAQSLFTAFAGLVAAVSLVTFGVTRWQSRRVAIELSQRVIESAELATESQLTTLFDPVYRQLARDHGLVGRGLVKRYDPPALVAQLLPSMEQLPQSGSMMIADETGHQFLVMKYDELARSSPLLEAQREKLPKPVAGELQYFTRDFRPAQWGARSEWTVWAPDGKTPVERFTIELPGYDPKGRPWYVQALASFAERTPAQLVTDPRSAIAWTDAYPLFTSKTPGISASIAARDPSGERVIVAYDILLDDLTAFTASRHPTPQGRVFVVTEDGRVVGLPAEPKFEQHQARADSLLKPLDTLGIPLISGAMARFHARAQLGTGDVVPAARIETDAGPAWVGFRRFPLDRTRGLWIGVAIPEADLMREAARTEPILLGLGVLALATSLLLARRLSRKFAEPLSELAARSERIASLDLEPAEPVRSRLREVNQLSSALDTMRDALARRMRERVVIEEQVRETQKMEAIGRLSGGIAHDFNNLLTVIMGYAAVLERRVGDDADGREAIDAILQTSRRAAEMTRQLLAFSRRQVVEPRVLDLRVELRELSKMLARLIGEDVELAIHTAPDLWLVRIDATQLQQLLVNLCVNARDAMPRGGKLAIEVSNRAHDGGDSVVIAVTDTGVGIPEEQRARIFEPFFTTKGSGKGTGLGLATCRAIVEAAGGRIDLSSEPGKGTRFEITLPALRDAEPSKPMRAEAPAGHGDETILLVEDDAAVRTVAVRALEERGYEVVVAKDGAEALEHARARGAAIDAIVTDVVMANVGGATLALELRATRPDVPLLFVSGNVDHPAVQELVLEGAAFLAKPYEPETLARRVRELLDRSRPA